jgi:hypothetical protein
MVNKIKRLAEILGGCHGMPPQRPQARPPAAALLIDEERVRDPTQLLKLRYDLQHCSHDYIDVLAFRHIRHSGLLRQERPGTRRVTTKDIVFPNHTRILRSGRARTITLCSQFKAV